MVKEEAWHTEEEAPSGRGRKENEGCCKRDRSAPFTPKKSKSFTEP